MALRYCPNCERNVDTYRRFSFLKLYLLLILLVIPGLIYLFTIRVRRCPICNMKESMLEMPRPYKGRPPHSSSGPFRPL